MRSANKVLASNSFMSSTHHVQGRWDPECRGAISTVSGSLDVVVKVSYTVVGFVASVEVGSGLSTLDFCVDVVNGYRTDEYN